MLKGPFMKKRPITKLCIVLLAIFFLCVSAISCGDNDNTKEEKTTADTVDDASSLEQDGTSARQSDTKSSNGIDLPIIWN